MEYLVHRGKRIPIIGYGTWCVGDDPAKHDSEVETILYAISEYGITLIDTAEMYGCGNSELLISDVIKKNVRENLFIVDKILPENAMSGNYEDCVRKSIKRLNCQYIDLYLLHWKSDVNLQNMVDSMEQLVEKKLIKNWGVSNFDVDEMDELWRCEKGNHCFANQVLYNVSERGIEYDLLDWCVNHNVLVMAYSVLGDCKELQTEILKSPTLLEIAKRHNVSSFNIMLRFVIRERNIVALMKTSSKEHLNENMKDVWIPLLGSDMEILDKDFPAPLNKIDLHKI